MSISDEAVKAMYESLPGWVVNYLDLETMRTALEAAAPHMLAAVLALADEADNRPGSMYGKVTTYQLRQALGADDE